MPLTLFTHQKTPEIARQFLQELGAEMEIDGENWSATFKKGLLRRKHMKISYGFSYYLKKIKERHREVPFHNLPKT